MLIQHGHFVWCARRNVRLARGCFHCKARAYFFACVLGVVLAVVEWYGSGLTQSLALFGDALHVGFDTLGYVIGLLSLWHGYLVSHDHNRFHHGQTRFEAAMGMFIAAAATAILKEAYGRLMEGSAREILETEVLFWIALAGLIGNVVVLVSLHALGVEHESCGHAHHRSRDEILRANVLHTLGDTVSSVLVVMNASIFAITDNQEWRFLDAVATLFIAALLYGQAWRMLAKNFMKK